MISLLVLITTFLLTISLNIWHLDPLVCIFNAVTLVTTILVCLKVARLTITRRNFFHFVSLAFLPIFGIAHPTTISMITPWVLLVWLLSKILIRSIRLWSGIGALLVIILISANLHLLTPSLHPNSTELISSQFTTQTAIINQHQQAALFLPYRLRPIFISNWIDLYSALSQTANLISLNNLMAALLLVNLYPLIQAIRYHLDQSNVVTFLILLLVGLLVAGFSRTVNSPTFWWSLSPLLIYLLITGFAQTKLKYYLLGLVISLFIITAPQP